MLIFVLANYHARMPKRLKFVAIGFIPIIFYDVKYALMALTVGFLLFLIINGANILSGK